MGGPGTGHGAPELAEGLWLRIRDVMLAERRLEGFAFAPDAPRGGSGLEALGRDEAAAGALARDLALRALRAGADPVNFRIVAAVAAGPVPLEALERAVDLPGLAVRERLSELAQVGLAARDLERNTAAATGAGRALVELVGAVSGALAERLRRGLPDILGS